MDWCDRRPTVARCRVGASTSSSSSSSSWMLLLLVGLAGPCAALLHMIKIYLDQIEKNETSGNNKLVQQRAIQGGERRGRGGSAVLSVVCGGQETPRQLLTGHCLEWLTHTCTHTCTNAQTLMPSVCVCYLWCMSDCSMPRQVLALSLELLLCNKMCLSNVAIFHSFLFLLTNQRV